MRERGLKLLCPLYSLLEGKSLPVRERGLKPRIRESLDLLYMSLPVRERGLKLVLLGVQSQMLLVAPRAGAWIETDLSKSITKINARSLPVRERGLKLF